MQRGRRLRILALGAAVALGLTACGSDSGGEGEALKLGYVFPESGELAELGPPQVSASKLAVKDINDAGGVLDQEISELIASDEGGKAEIANASVDRLLGENVDAIIGPAASGMTMAVIDKIKGAEKVQCSGSNTTPVLTDYEDDGYYFRTAPTDKLQGPILADLITGEGHQKVAVTYRADDYGKGLAEAVKASLESVGATVPVFEGYEPNTTNFDAISNKVADSNPDAVFTVSFAEGGQYVSKLIESGIEADTIFSADGLKEDDLGGRVAKNNPGVIAGLSGTGPASVENKEFDNALREFDPELETFQFAPQVYDCVIVVALAAQAADTTDPTEFKDEVIGVTKDGEECTSYEQCLGLLQDDKDIDYNGRSGPLDFTDVGEPAAGQFEIYEFNKNGKLEIVDTVDSKPID